MLRPVSASTCLSTLALLTSLIALPADAQAQQQLFGVIVDSTGTPIRDVSITLRDSGGTQRRAISSEDGSFTFEQLPPGKAALTATATGWDPLEVVTDAPSSSDGVRLVMRPAGIEETVVVIGALDARQPLHPESADLLGSVDIVGADQLERENVDLSYELLKRVPGVYVSDFNQGIIGGGVAIRGFNTEGDIMHTKLLVDGIPTNLNSGLPMMDAVFPFDIDRLEIVKGTNDPRYGLFNIAGNVHLFTSPLGRYTKAKLLGGAYGTGDAQAVSAFSTGRLSHVYFGGFRHSTGYRNNSDLERYTFSGKWFYAPATNVWQLGVIARTYDFDTQAPGYLTAAEAALEPRASPAFSATDGGTQRTHHISVHFDRQLRRTLALSVKAYRQTFDQHRWVRFTAAGAQQERVEDESQAGGLATLTWRPPSLTEHAGVVSFGIDYQRQDNTARRFRTIERARDGVLRDQTFDLANGGAYAMADVRPIRWLRVTGGIRGDRFDGDFANRLASSASLPILDYGTIWQPKAGVLVTVREGLNLYANYGRSFQVGVGPGAYGTQPLDHSKNDGWESGVRLAPRPWLAARVGVWGQDASDELRLKFDNSGDSENVGRTRRRGWNIDATAKPHSTTYVWGTLTRQRATLVEPGATQAQLRGHELNHVPHYTAKGGVDMTPVSRLSLSLWADVQTDYYLTPANAEGRFGGRRLTHLDVLFRAHRSMTVGVHGKNLFDRYHEYVWFDGVSTLHSPGERRAFYVTTTWEL
jgi:iron complex outermembrane recepter protein